MGQATEGIEPPKMIRTLCLESSLCRVGAVLGEVEAGGPGRILFGELVRGVDTGFRLMRFLAPRETGQQPSSPLPASVASSVKDENNRADFET